MKKKGFIAIETIITLTLIAFSIINIVKDNLNQFHLYKAAQDYETLKSGLGEYVKKVEQQRTKYVKTLTGEYLRSVQEVQIANFAAIFCFPENRLRLKLLNICWQRTLRKMRSE